MSNAKNSAAAQPAPAIDLKQGLRDLYRAYVRLLESGRDRITSLGGDCDPVDVMEQTDIDLRKVRDLLALIDGQASPHPEGTPMMPAGRFYDGCWKLAPEGVRHHARMLTQSWRAADSLELKRALEAGVLALIDGQKNTSVADTLRTLLAERSHRTDGTLQELADRCLHLSRGDRDLIALRGRLIEKLQPTKGEGE